MGHKKDDKRISVSAKKYSMRQTECYIQFNCKINLKITAELQTLPITDIVQYN
jgi:hypothetical protein